MALKVSFSPLWKKLKKLSISIGEFQSVTGLGSSTMTKLRNNECVTTDTLVKICQFLHCDLNEIIILEEEKNDKN
ncbi:helix-turn-helix domain-containing protein [Streptococcus pluranimalium]